MGDLVPDNFSVVDKTAIADKIAKDIESLYINYKPHFPIYGDIVSYGDITRGYDIPNTPQEPTPSTWEELKKMATEYQVDIVREVEDNKIKTTEFLFNPNSNNWIRFYADVEVVFDNICISGRSFQQMWKIMQGISEKC